MNAVKEFEEQKELIMGLVNDLIVNNASKKAVAKLVEINHLIRGIQPPRPTCATCNKEETSCNIVFTMGANKIEGFGCTLHSDYEEMKHE